MDFSERILKGQNRALRRPGIEPGSPRWQRGIIPLNHRRAQQYDHILVESAGLVEEQVTRAARYLKPTTRKKKAKKIYSNRTSHVVPHHSTNRS